MLPISILSSSPNVLPITINTHPPKFATGSFNAMAKPAEMTAKTVAAVCIPSIQILAIHTTIRTVEVIEIAFCQ